MYRRPVLVKHGLAAGGIAILLGLGGCGPKPPAINTVATTATVTYKGQPVEGAQVGFFPTDRTSGKTATGVTDATGRATLKTLVGGSTFATGALAGDYEVTVTKAGSPVADTMGPKNPGQPMTEEERVEMIKNMAKPKQGADGKAEMPAGPAESKSQLPEKYTDASTSLLKAIVKVGDKNDFTFELTD